MTDEDIFITDDYFKKLDIPYCLINNTLLGLLRDKQPFKTSTQVPVFVPIKYRDKIIIDRTYEYNLCASTTSQGNINILLNYITKSEIAIHFQVEQDGCLINNLIYKLFFIYDKDIIFPLKKLKYKGYQLPIPHKPEQLLREYYGDWEVRHSKKWDWEKAPNIIHADSVDKAIKKYKEKHERH
jgi:phosphorylcholine metabolism protein LicD